MRLVRLRKFSKITPLTGLVLTKLDGSAKGGVVLAIRQELDIPVKLIGFGEKIDDIGEFHSEEFMQGLLTGFGLKECLKRVSTGKKDSLIFNGVLTLKKVTFIGKIVRKNACFEK